MWEFLYMCLTRNLQIFSINLYEIIENTIGKEWLSYKYYSREKKTKTCRTLVSCNTYTHKQRWRTSKQPNSQLKHTRTHTDESQNATSHECTRSCKGLAFGLWTGTRQSGPKGRPSMRGVFFLLFFCGYGKDTNQWRTHGVIFCLRCADWQHRCGSWQGRRSQLH